jgi:hypothetical protein
MGVLRPRGMGLEFQRKEERVRRAWASPYRV